VKKKEIGHFTVENETTTLSRNVSVHSSSDTKQYRRRKGPQRQFVTSKMWCHKVAYFRSFAAAYLLKTV